jgi:hypothetical protein
MTKDPDGQERHLRAIKTAGGDGYTVEMALGELAEARHDKAATRAALEAAHRFDPTQPDPMRGLLRAGHGGEARRGRAERACASSHGSTSTTRRRGSCSSDKLVEGQAVGRGEARRGGGALRERRGVLTSTSTTHAPWRPRETTRRRRSSSESALLCESKPQAEGRGARATRQGAAGAGRYERREEPQGRGAEARSGQRGATRRG